MSQITLDNPLKDLEIRECRECFDIALYKAILQIGGRAERYLCAKHTRALNPFNWSIEPVGKHTKTGVLTPNEAEKELQRLLGRTVQMYNKQSGLKCQVILDNWNHAQWCFYGKITHNKQYQHKLNHKSKGDWVLVPVNSITEIQSL